MTTTERLSVAYVLASPRPGGSERQMLTLARHLPHEAFAVEFISLIAATEYDRKAEAEGIRVRRLGTAPAPAASSLARLGSRGSKAIEYSRTVRRRGYHIVDAWLYPADVLAAVLRGVTRTPIVISGRRNTHPHDRFGPMSGLVDRLLAPRLDAVVANSKAAADAATSMHHVDPRRIRIIRNGVELPRAVSAAERQQARAMLDAGPDDFLIGCIANLLPVKDHASLIDVFATIVADRPEARLVLLGDGPLRGELEERARQRGVRSFVRYQGSVLDPLPFYDAFDLVVQSSLREGSPNAMLEAAAAGRPLVATDAGGTSEIVIDGVTGLLVPVGNASALASAIRRCMDDATLRSTMAAAARAHVAREFGLERFVREFAELYQALAREKGVLSS